MRILYVSNLYPPSIGGAQLHLHRLAKEMQKAGNQVSVVTLTCRNRRDWLRLSTICSEPRNHYAYEGIEVSQLGFTKKNSTVHAPRALGYYALIGPAARKISAHMLPYLEEMAKGPQLVHGTRIGREFISRAALDFARKFDIPFVLTPNHHPRWKGYLYREYDRIYREADALFALTLAEKQTLVEKCGVREERVHVTGIGPLLAEKYSIEAFRSRTGIIDRFVLYLGQQYKYKGIKAILTAAPLVWRNHPEVRFVFAGPHTADSYQLFRAPLDPRIVNLGQVDLETKTAALAASDFLCLPSTQESFGGVYVEAWSMSKAVIGGRIGPIANVVDEGRNGLLSSQNPSELAEAISYLLAHPEECRSMGRAGCQKVEEKYTWEKLAKKTAQVYDSLVR